MILGNRGEPVKEDRHLLTGHIRIRRVGGPITSAQRDAVRGQGIDRRNAIC